MYPCTIHTKNTKIGSTVIIFDSALILSSLIDFFYYVIYLNTSLTLTWVIVCPLKIYNGTLKTLLDVRLCLKAKANIIITYKRQLL